MSCSESEEHNEPRQRNRRVILRPVNHFVELDDYHFQKRYRVTKESFLLILGRILDGLQQPYGRNRRITPIIQLLTALRYYATGSYLQVIADCGNISRYTVWAIIHRVSPLIASLKDEFIQLPSTPNEMMQAQAEMFRISAFPRVIACLDGKHVPIDSYGGENAELFRNRHGAFSINVLGACNARLEFVAFEARWPGSTHDSIVFRNSTLYRDFQRGRYGDVLLLGDSGYPEMPYLMTPVLNPVTAAEQLYNEAQIRTRNCIERWFGLWAKRFPVIGKGGTRFRRVQRTLAVIVATAVVHNIALRNRPRRRRRLNVAAYNRIRREVRLGQGDSFRQQLINGYFQQLI